MSRTLLSVPLLLVLASAVASQDLQPLLGQPVPGLTQTQLRLFEQGRVAFATPIPEAEGLGPIFNDPGCGSCHNHPAQGGSGTREVFRFGKAGPPFDPLDHLGGSLLQEQAIDVACMEFIPPEADVVAKRLTPICFGAGLLEVMLDQDIVDNENNQPPGLNGYVSWVADLAAPSDPPQPARFGWKGVVADVMTFSIDASLNEMGLTSVFLPVENAPNGDQALLAACDHVADPEDVADAQGFTRIDRFTHFQRFLAAPPQTPPSGMAGEAIFAQVGCADCHVPAYTTGGAPEAALTNVDIQPYSDFLLHDMGALGDQIEQGNAPKDVMFTRALWGLRQRVSLMHDGRVTGNSFEALMDQCVQEHEGEGAASRSAYNALGQASKDALARFLGSLGQAEFDYEDLGGLIKAADNDRDDFDWFFIEPFFTGQAPGSFTVDDYAAVCDVQGDGDFDLREFGLFQRGFTGSLIGVDPPTFKPAGNALRLTVSAGHSTVHVAPGGLVRYDVTAELAHKHGQGLAMFAFDLAFDGGPLPQAEAPAHGPMVNFDSPLGMSNPGAFGGTPSGGALLQVGGAMNTINNVFAPQPSGPVLTGLASRGAPQILVEGSFTAPAAPGTYTLSLAAPMANLITADTDGATFWEVQPAAIGAVRDLTVIVEAGAPEVYCAGKTTSQGCVPSIDWGGTPSVSGPDDFMLRARDVVAGEPGLVFVGLGAQNLPFKGGTLCVGALVGRAPTVTAFGSDTCGGTLQVILRQGNMAHMGLNPGDVAHAQWYFRDSAHPDGTATGLSDALKFTIQP